MHLCIYASMHLSIYLFIYLLTFRPSPNQSYSNRAQKGRTELGCLRAVISDFFRSCKRARELARGPRRTKKQSLDTSKQGLGKAKQGLGKAKQGLGPGKQAVGPAEERLGRSKAETGGSKAGPRRTKPLHLSEKGLKHIPKWDGWKRVWTAQA